MMTLRRPLLALACTALLAACGSETDRSPVGAMLVAKAKGVMAARHAQPAAMGPITREAIEKYGMPLLRVTIASRGVDGLLTIRDTDGDITTWTTTDGTTFAFRNGVLIETRGLGSDLMSAASPGPAQLLASGRPYKRSYHVSGPDDSIDRRRYDCVTEFVGGETIEIVQRSHSVTHIQETCTRSVGKLTSDYWLEGQMIRKSRQWVSPGIGYVEFERVVD